MGLITLEICIYVYIYINIYICIYIYKHRSYFFGGSFCKAEILKIQRDKLESESGKIWISMEIRNRRVRCHL